MIMKLGTTQLELLLEALRRYTRFHQGEVLTEAWTGSGSYSEYRPCLKAGLMDYAVEPNPGYSTWWKLTDKGAVVVQSWLDAGYSYENVENVENGYECAHYHSNCVTAIDPLSFCESEGSDFAFFDDDSKSFVYQDCSPELLTIVLAYSKRAC